MKLASRFGRVNKNRRDRPLTHEELMQYVPSVFGENKHESRSERYTYIPTITLLDNLRREGFHPFFACQTRVRDVGKPAKPIRWVPVVTSISLFIPLNAEF